MKTYIKKTIEAITEYLNDLSDNDLLNVHNEYCQSINDSDSEIFNNDEDFFNTFFNGKVMDAIRAVSFGDYRYSDDYIIFNGHANLETFNNVSDHIDISAIAEDIMENEQNYYGFELEEEEED